MGAQKEKLEAEGHTVICRGRKNIRYFVKDYENALFDFTQGRQLPDTYRKEYALTAAGMDKRMISRTAGKACIGSAVFFLLCAGKKRCKQVRFSYACPLLPHLHPCTIWYKLKTMWIRPLGPWYKP